MKLEIVKSISHNNYSVEFKITEVSKLNQEAFDEFGYESINIGGYFPITLDGVDTAFKVTEDIKVLPLDFPFTKTFKDSSYNGKGKEHANAYIKEIKDRIEVAMATIDAKVDDFSGTEVVVY